MITALANKYLLNEFQLIHVHNYEKGQVYAILGVKRKKSRVSVRMQEYGLDYGQLSKHLKKNLPVVLSITGKKIIDKAVAKQSNYLEKVLFNNSPEDFYIFEVFQEDKVLISLARKGEIDEVIHRFSKQGFPIIDFSIGPYILENLKSFFPDQPEINHRGFSYDFNTGEFYYDEPAGHSDPAFLTVGDEKLDYRGLIPFSSFINFLNNENTVSNFNPYKASLQEDYIYKKISRSVSILGVVVLFVILSIGFVVNTVYTEKSAKLQEALFSNDQVKARIVRLEKDLAYKQNIIKGSNLGSRDYLAFYLSQIADGLPTDIIFNEIHVFPVQGQRNEGDKIKITPNMISIKGATLSNQSVNQWISMLESFPWVAKAEMSSYVHVKNEYLFTINLTL